MTGIALQALTPLRPTPRPLSGIRGGDRVAELISTGRYDAALTILLPRLNPGSEDVVDLDQAATCFWQLGRVDDALHLMARLVEGWPDLTSGWIKLASISLSAGRMDAARRAVEEGLQRNPRSVRALALLNRMDPIAPGSTREGKLRRLARVPQLSVTERALACHTLGRIAEAAQQPAQAFRHYTAANRLIPARFDSREIDGLVAAQILRFDPGRLPTGPAADLPQMTFVVGAPRSGTTLMEAILGRHSAATPIGESMALGQTIMALRRHVVQRFGPGNAWAWFCHLDALDLAPFRAMFRSLLPPRALAGGGMLISKMPLDCLELGAAAALLPHARFIYMDRHPLDVGLSNFTTLFQDGHGFSKRLDWTAQMIRAVGRSADDYEAKLDRSFRRQSYAALVSNPKEEISAVLAHLGLPWEEACLRPEASHAVALTASMEQVRRPISTGALGKWTVFARQLTPLKEALGGAAFVEEWERCDARHCA